MNSSAATSRYKTVQSAYDTVAEDYAALLPDTRAEAPLDLAMIDAFAAAVGPKGHVLDAGCGTGRIGRYLAGRNLHVTGLDVSAAMVSVAASAQRSGAFVVGSISHLPFANQSFDGVVLWYSTIHTAEDGQSRLYEETTRVLRDGGHLLVGFQSGAGIHDTAATYRAYGHEVELVRYRFTSEEVAAWMYAAGLQEISRMTRRPTGSERDAQAVLLARRPPAGGR